MTIAIAIVCPAIAVVMVGLTLSMLPVDLERRNEARRRKQLRRELRSSLIRRIK